MKDTDYAYCVARLRAKESSMLTDNDMEKLLGFDEYAKAVKYLKDKNWIVTGQKTSDYISYQRQELWSLLSESVPSKKELDILCTLNDYFNIKAAVKCLLCGKDAANYFIYPTTVDLRNVKAKLDSHDFATAFGENADTAKKAYDAAVKSENGQNADIIIDKAAIECMLQLSMNRKNEVSGRICTFLCDSSNIRIAVRCALTGKNRDFCEEAVGKCSKLSRSKLIDEAMNGADSLFTYLESTDYAEGANAYKQSGAKYEKWCDDTVLKIASEAKYTAFGFGPVCLYYYKKLREIKNVSMILSSIELGADKNEIKERIGCIDV